MSERTAVSAGELYVMLDREFRLMQSHDCPACYILLPYRVDQPDPDAPNWEFVLPPDCANGCTSIVEDLIKKYWELYELAPEEDRR